MKTGNIAHAAVVAAGVMVSACGPISFAELSSGLVSSDQDAAIVKVCQGASAKLQNMALLESVAAKPKTSILPETVYNRTAVVQRAIQPALAQEGVAPQNSVLHQLLNAANVTAYQTHNSLVQLANLPGGTQSPPPTAPPHDLTMSDFLALAATVKRLLFDAQTLQKTLDTDVENFQKDFLLYFSTYFKGNYYDRFGNNIPAPAVSTTLGDSEIAGTMTVLVDLIMDYVLRTPVWVDKTPSPTAYFPGGAGSTGTKNQPTVLSAFPELATPLVAEPAKGGTGCGITELKTEAIHYIAVSAGNRASLLVGAVGGSFGGIDIGLGVLGKVSIGDNKTLQTLAKTALQIAFTHIGESASSKVLLVLPNIGGPKPTVPANIYAEVLKYVQQYLDAQQKATSAVNG